MAVFNIEIQNLKEDLRPTLYRALKYWGKKPHNIWRELIINNSKAGEIVYDPFAGSALTFFECIRTGRKPIIADINPLTLFLVQVYSREYNIQKLIKRFEEIEKIVSLSKIYKNNYVCVCSKCGNETNIYNYRRDKHAAAYYSYKCDYCQKTVTQENDKSEYLENLGYWKPDKEISLFTSVCESSLKSFGSDNIASIWTERNLEILSNIFYLITESEEDIQDPLMFAFLQTLHLTTKMCALRSEKTNRPLSTSWGRPAYMFLNRNMEQNPLIQFKRSLFEKNGVIKALESRKKYLPEYTFSTEVEDIDKVDGIVLHKDSRDITNIRADLVITDPPYGSIIQYGELSTIWNVWLEKYNKKYCMDLSSEIIIKKDNNYSKYIKDMTIVLSNCYNILSDNSLVIMTFNSNNNKDWESLEKAIQQSNWNIKYKYIQKNRRSSEANVIGTTELSKCDYYLVLEKE